MPKLYPIVPCLWFDGQAEDAAKHYVSIFPGSHITRIARYTKAGRDIHGHEPGSVLSVAFELGNQPMTALNGGPQFKLSEAVSLQVMCDTQAEIDDLWSQLSAGGDEAAQQCGWLKDRYGLSWQIVPSALPDMVADPDVGKAGRVMQALMTMKKLDLAKLRQAYDAS